ncbi:Calcium-dependent protein kinase 4 [Tulasnella sp. 403]|nr:Calcium-dependent protein kinase 4 [Tulasnella sp. 403]
MRPVIVLVIFVLSIIRILPFHPLIRTRTLTPTSNSRSETVPVPRPLPGLLIKRPVPISIRVFPITTSSLDKLINTPHTSATPVGRLPISDPSIADISSPTTILSAASASLPVPPVPSYEVSAFDGASLYKDGFNHTSTSFDRRPKTSQLSGLNLVWLVLLLLQGLSLAFGVPLLPQLSVAAQLHRVRRRGSTPYGSKSIPGLWNRVDSHKCDSKATIKDSFKATIPLPPPTSILGYTYIDRLGIGAFGQVHHVRANGKDYAMKMVDRPYGNEPAFDPIEVIVTSILNHPNIGRSFCRFDTEDYHCIVYEYIQGCELFDHLHSVDGPVCLSEATARRLARQLGSALLYCHSNNVVHGGEIPQRNPCLDLALIDADIHPQNIMTLNRGPYRPAFKAWAAIQGQNKSLDQGRYLYWPDEKNAARKIYNPTGGFDPRISMYYLVQEKMKAEEGQAIVAERLLSL